MDGINRLAKMLEGQKDKYLNIIVNYLMQQIDLDVAFLNEEKNLKDMAKYIKNSAQKQATGNVAVIEDSVVFQWAKDYFVKTNEELGINKKENKVVEIKKDDEFGSIFDIASPAQTEKQKEEIEQISLFAA